MKVITPTLTCFPKKSACSNTLAKCSLCALGEHPETAADTVLLNRTGNTEKCGGHRARTVSDAAKNNFHAAGLIRSSHIAGCNSFPLHHTSCHEVYGEMGWSQVPPGSSWLPLQPCFRISLRKTISAAITQILPTAPCISLSVSLTHTRSYFLFSCWQETPYLEGYALLWYICFWSTEWLLDSGILNFQGERILLSQQTLKSVSWTC